MIMEKKEFKVGEVFQFGFVKLQCVKANNKCEGCYLDSTDICSFAISSCVGNCKSEKREDKTNVIFVKMEE